MNYDHLSDCSISFTDNDKMSNNVADPRRPDRITRYVAPSAVVTANGERKDVPGEVRWFG